MADSAGGGLGQWLVDLVMKPGTSLQLASVECSREREIAREKEHSSCRQKRPASRT